MVEAVIGIQEASGTFFLKAMPGRARKNDDTRYEIESVSKALVVFETLVDGPLREQRIVEKTKLNRNFVMSALCTLRIRGFATQNERGEWMVGQNFIKFAQEVLNSDSAGI